MRLIIMEMISDVKIDFIEMIGFIVMNWEGMVVKFLGGRIYCMINLVLLMI